MIHPLDDLRCLILFKPLQQWFWFGVGEDHGPVIFLHKTFPDGVVDELEQGCVIAVQIEQTARLLMVAELCPGEDFEKLFQGAAAAGQGDKSVGQLRHQGFSLMHGADDMEVGQAGVGDFPVDQGFGDDADHLSPVGQNRIGNGAHQTDAGPAVDQSDARLRQGDAQLFGPFHVDGAGAGIGAAKYTDVFHR